MSSSRSDNVTPFIHMYICFLVKTLSEAFCSPFTQMQSDALQSLTLYRVWPYAECTLFQILTLFRMWCQWVFAKCDINRVGSNAEYYKKNNVTKCRISINACECGQMQSLTICRVWPYAEYNHSVAKWRVWSNAELSPCIA